MLRQAEVSSMHTEDEIHPEFHLQRYDFFGHGTISSNQQAEVVALSKLTCLVLPHEYGNLLQTKSIWNADKGVDNTSFVEQILHLKPLEVNIFQGITLPDAPRFGKVFGGQFIGQALAAASKTVDCLKIVHSLHAYFLLVGDVDMPIIYHVHRVRDGKSFATRRVEAIQKGIVVFTLTASFQKEEEGFNHQDATMPSVPNPDTLLSMEELREKRLTDPRLPRTYRNKVATRKFTPWPIEIRFCRPNTSTNNDKSPPSLNYWFRARGKLSDDQNLHRCVVAYASDLLFLQISLNPHREKGLKTSAVSLDHSIWFHRSFRADDWLLFVIHSPNAHNARGFVTGQMFTQKGEIIIRPEFWYFGSMESDLDASGSSERWSCGIKHCDTEESSLIPGLPDDIAFICLARIPRQYHPVMKCVCVRWKDLADSEEWYSYRKRHDLVEAWIYALGKDKYDQLCCFVLDPSRPSRGWNRISGIPSCCMKRKGMRFEVLGKRLYLLGGSGWSEDTTNEVYCYDAATNSWSPAASLSVARCNFACEAVNDKIYAIGGLGPNSRYLNSLDVYNPKENVWSSHVFPHVLGDVEDSVILNGKIYIRFGSNNAIAYDPSNHTWEHADPELVAGWFGPAAVVDGNFYVLNHNLGNQMMKWVDDRRQWVSVGRFASKKIQPPCQLVSIGKKILIIGKGLNTTVFHTENAWELQTLSSPFRSTTYDIVSDIDCKCVAI
ncbi:OLC1v1039244C2 [Oldenlandia corymbosa var. corymbosa]|uniref:OLC1v1039244C2 n=1 Tax=Oldenlandia corymbosa var. corymbosa TaxID=529605 RepID=A0AAV1D2L8_OLDCO|nr:OLC1v1039244C2 [Oldenlandia corymbosa var. corymbosa]